MHDGEDRFKAYNLCKKICRPQNSAKGGYITECKDRGNKREKIRMIRCSNTLAEVYARDKHGTERRYQIDIANMTCSCRKW